MAAPIIAAAGKALVAKLASDPKKARRFRNVVAAVALLLVGALVAAAAVGVSMALAAINAILPSNLTLEEGFCAPDWDEDGNEIPGEFYAADASDVPETIFDPSASGAGGALAPTSRVVMPVPEGRYRLTSQYGMRHHPIYNYPRMHAGMDFGAQPRGATDIPILAVTDGVVERADVAGGLGHIVTIRHSINGETWVSVYGHLQANSQTVAPGQRVVAGQQIGLMGNTGDSTGVHLHFEWWKNAYGARAGGQHTNPATFLQNSGAVAVTEALHGGGFVNACGSVAGAGGAGPWGGHENGRIPAEEMCAAPSFPGHLFRCDAASAFEALNAAFAAEFGRNLNLTDSYRSYEAQVQCRAQKGNLCAQPGTSNHGWGLATDVEIESFDSTEYKWMRANAGRFGWVHPGWAQAGGAKPEPWHWEFSGGSGGSSADATTPAGAKAFAQAQMAAYGWSAHEFNACLVPLWNRESGWDYRAANPTSTARGIPQKMMSLHHGSGWQKDAAAQQFLSDPKVQVNWGLDYIKNRYGTPCGAWQHSEARGWY